jgi:hypothetical protein
VLHIPGAVEKSVKVTIEDPFTLYQKPTLNQHHVPEFHIWYIVLGLGYVLGLCMPTLYALMSYVVAIVDDMVFICKYFIAKCNQIFSHFTHACSSLACQDRGGMCQVFAAVESKEGK